MTIGSLITLTTNGQISAGSPSTINILFPTLASGGFMVNSVANVVDPADPSTGFFVMGNQVTGLGFPGFNVIYGSSALPPPVQQELNQIVALTNQQTTLNDEEKKQAEEGGSGEPGAGEKDKKELPVCK